MMKVISLAKASMKRFWRDPTALFFTIFFPLIFLVIFGAIFGGDGGDFNSKVAFFSESDTEFANNFITQADEDPSFDIEEFESYEEAEESLTRSQIDAILQLPAEFGQINEQGKPSGQMNVQFLESRADDSQALLAVLNGVFTGINQEIDPYEPPFTVNAEPLSKAALDGLDYLVSGILGFAIMGLAIFGMANGFTSDKKTGAIARLRAAPIKSYHVVLSTAMVYAVLGIVSVLLIIITATLMYDFDMVGDWFSFAAFTVLSTISLLGIGLIIGGWAKNDKQAAPIAQLVAFPMMFLSGVFFPVFLMPEWLQNISKFIPLTPVNEGLRLITAEGLTIFDLGSEILILLGWGVVSYLVAFRVFRWE